MLLKAYLTFQANNKKELRIELTNTTGTYLQHINDDCLLEIFSVKSLALMDLCSLAEACTRFQRITERVFPKELWIDICLNGHCEVVSRYSPFRGNRAHEIERILRNFGSFISALSISRHTREDRAVFVLNLVTKYCVDTLERLRIHSQIGFFEIPAVLTIQLKPIFKRLQLLELRNAVIVDDETLFTGFDSLIELRVIMVENGFALLENIFPKLQRFTFQGMFDKVDHSLPIFISRHTSLKSLDLRIRIFERCKVNVLQVIGNCKDLEKLTINMGCTKAASLLPLQALKSLERLKLWFVSCDDLSFVPSMTKLRELHLTTCVLPEDPNSFASMIQLTKLHITLEECDTVDVVDIIRRLINLEELTVEYGRSSKFVLDEETFTKIVKLVKGRRNVLALKCEFDFFYNSENCDENQKVRLMRLFSARNKM